MQRLLKNLCKFYEIYFLKTLYVSIKFIHGDHKIHLETLVVFYANSVIF